jgi:beta-glucosidase
MSPERDTVDDGATRADPVMSFPDGFLWGAATASYQIEGAADEGGRGPSVWDTFSHTPGKVANGHTGDVACDHYHRMDQDVAMMAELGLQGYRFSIAWPRVMPDGRGTVNHEGVAFYDRLVDRLLERGITPCPTLFHWDLPQALEDLGGFRNRDTTAWFSEYASLMVRTLGDRVSMWSTFNEPWVYAYLGHAAGVHAPGLTDPKAAVTVAHHELLAHGLAVQAMRDAAADLRIGIVINSSNIRSEGEPPAPAEQLALIDAIHNRWWFDALFRQEYPATLLERYGELAAAVRPGDLEIIAQPLDWLGINYYFDVLVRGLEGHQMPEYPMTEGVADAHVRATHTDMGWPITPSGLTALLVRLRDDYPNLPPIYITENGCAYDDPVIDGRCADPRRIDYLDQHLRALRDAIDSGVDVRGYFQWSLMDNFEWALGYDKRFGLVHVDFETLQRTPRDSAAWYRDVITRRA